MHWNRVACTCASIGLLWIITTPQPLKGQVTAQNLVETALQRNREYLAAKAKLSEADALLRQAGIRPTPSVEIETATGKLLGSAGESEFSAAYFHTIETAGKRNKRIQVAQRALELARAEVDERRRQLTFEVKTRYAQAVTEQLKVATINRLVPVNRESYQMTVTRVELGDAAPIEQRLLATDMNRSEAQQTMFGARYDAALLDLKNAVGLSKSDNLELPADADLQLTTAPALELLIDYALQNRPDLRILAAAQDQAAAEAEQARSEGTPDLTASARYTHTNSRFDQLGLSPTGGTVPLVDHDNVATFGLAVPLFTKKRTEGAVSAAMARKTQAELRIDHLRQVIPQEVEASYRRWTGSQRMLQILKTGVIQQSENNLMVIREAYRLGQLRLFDVLNEQRKLIETELTFVDAQSEAAQALAELEKAVGGILP